MRRGDGREKEGKEGREGTGGKARGRDTSVQPVLKIFRHSCIQSKSEQAVLSSSPNESYPVS